MNFGQILSFAAASVAISLPVAAAAQTTGISHPDETIITNSPEALPPPNLQPSRAPAVALQPRPEAFQGSAASATVIAGPIHTQSLSHPQQSPAFDPDANIVLAVDAPANQLPIGTLVKARLGQTIGTTLTAEGTPFTAELTEAVARDGHIFIPAGSLLEGRVTEVHGGRRIAGGAAIHLQPDSLTLPDGTRYRFAAQVVDTDLFHSTKVDQEGTISSRGHKAEVISILALTTGTGAVAGALLAGPAGAVVGAGIGAGISTVVWLKQDRQASLPVNTRIIFSLTEPLSFGELGNGLSGASRDLR